MDSNSEAKQAFQLLCALEHRVGIDLGGILGLGRAFRILSRIADFRAAFCQVPARLTLVRRRIVASARVPSIFLGKLPSHAFLHFLARSETTPGTLLALALQFAISLGFRRAIGI